MRSCDQLSKVDANDNSLLKENNWWFYPLNAHKIDIKSDLIDVLLLSRLYLNFYEGFVHSTQLHFEFFSFLYKNLITYIALELK